MNKKKIISYKFLLLLLTTFILLNSFITVNSKSINSFDCEIIAHEIISDQANWTYMVYWVGDMEGDIPGGDTINFDNATLEIINMLEFSGSSSEVNLLVQADDYEMWGGKKVDKGSTRRYHIQYDNNPDELADYTLNENVWYLKEQNMGDPDTLKDFITWATSNYPAENYILTIFGHGEGWIQICQDYSSGFFPPLNYFNPDTSISISKDLENALSSCPYLDILFLYGCHMGQIEVFYEFREYADIILATENFGAESPVMFKNPVENLTSNPKLTSVELAQMIVDNYNPELYYTYDLWSPLFGIQTKDLGNIVKAVNNLTETITDQIHINRIKTRQMIAQAFTQSIMRTPIDDFHNAHAHDLYLFAKEMCNLTKDSNLNIYNTAVELLSVIDNSSIIRHSKKTRDDYHGLAVFSPPRAKPNLKYYYKMNIWLEIIPRNSYKSLDFAKDTQWDEILDFMYPLRRIVLKILNLN